MSETEALKTSEKDGTMYDNLKNKDDVYKKLASGSGAFPKKEKEPIIWPTYAPVTKESLPFSTTRFNQDALKQSENFYQESVKKIVDLSKESLIEIKKDKKGLREYFESFFVRIISAQYLVLTLFMFLNAASPEFNISDTVFVAYISSVFAQTLGGIIIMITFAFKSEEEVKIISVLNTFIETFQKFKKE